MKDDFDPRVLAQYTWRHQPKQYLFIKARRAIILMRKARLAFQSKGTKGPPAPAIKLRKDNLLAQAPAYQKNGYCAVNGFVDDASHAAIKKGWPPMFYLKPSTSIFKSYNFGFKWLRDGKDPEHLHEFPAMASLYEMLRSEDTSRAVTELCGDGIYRTCYSVATSWATGGSALIPHMDGISQRKGGESFLNFIFFVNANGAPEDCGGTAIYESNNYDKVLLRPKSMQNTLLAYRSDKDIYHGFEPLKPGKFRWAVLAQYASPEYKLEEGGL